MRVLLFSDFGLPDSCANATRVMNIAKLLREMNHETDLLGVAYKKEESLHGCIDSISFQMLCAPQLTGIMAYKRTKQIKKDLETYLKDKLYDIVILSNVYYDFSSVFFKYSRETGAKLVVNAVEWYDANNAMFKGIFGTIKLIKNRVALKYLHRKMKNILAISSFLEEYYKIRGCNTITVPTIVDIEKYNAVLIPSASNGNMVRIAYAGSPAKKDYIVNAVYAIELLTVQEQEQIELHFYGPKYEQLLALGVSEDYLNRHKSNIICHGRIPYEQVQEKIAAADFTVLLRPNKRYANAGFPTKVGESMACGTPVIANHTSDLHKYIIDGITGVVCSDETAESCAAAFRRVLAMTDADKKTMRAAASQVAQEHFCYKSYKEAFAKFLERCYAK